MFIREKSGLYRGECNGVLYRISRAQVTLPWTVKWFEEDDSHKLGGRWRRIGTAAWIDEAQSLAEEHARSMAI